MNEWVCQQISVLHERFSNTSHWVHQRIPVLRERFSGTLRWVREQILVLREHFHNARRIDQILLITIVLSTLSLPIYFFVPISRLGEISAGIFFCILTVDFLRRERYPALKRWIAETEHCQNKGKDPSYVAAQRPGNEELPAPPPTWRRIFRILGRIFSYRIFSMWQSLQLFDRLYVLAVMIMLVGFVFFLIHGKPTKSVYGSLLLAYGVSSIGFGIWLWPWLQRVWRGSFGRLALALLHGGILLLSIIPARLLVAEALGLPPQDFDVTVAFCVLLFYLPLWLIVFEFFTLLFVIIRFIAALCLLIFPVNVLVLLIARLFLAGDSPASSAFLARHQRLGES